LRLATNGTRERWKEFFMAYLRKLALAGAAALAFASTMAKAADMPLPSIPAPVEFGGWYLRGDIGMSNQSVKRLDSPAFTPDVNVLEKAFDSAPTFGIGIGYQYNNWLRFDVTTEWRGNASFHGLDAYDTGITSGTNDYTGHKSEWLTLFNAYVDLGTWNRLTPYVGAGVGVTQNTISNFKDVNDNQNAVGYSKSHSDWDFAWALHAGVTYQVTPTFLIDLSYRYVNLGDGSSGDMIGFDGTNPTYNPIEFKTITSHDFRFGARWLLADGFMPRPYEEPLVRKY
jgi:opacity protein-like surface antigen